MLLGVLVVLSTLVFAVQQGTSQKEITQESHAAIEDGIAVDPNYRISAIAIPEDFEFCRGSGASGRSGGLPEAYSSGIPVNTYWQSNALSLMKRAQKYFPIIEPILLKKRCPGRL